MASGRVTALMGQLSLVALVVLSGYPSAFAQTADATIETRPLPDEVTTILDHRCVVCHSCYDAPCQLKLTSPEGLLRGASKEAVYHSDRLRDAVPTRLGVDATTVPGWRALGFHSVTAPADLNLMERYLELGRSAEFTPDAPLPDELDLALDRPLVCPAPKEFEAFRENHPLAGMPYAMAPLNEQEYQTLASWARNGAVLSETRADLPDDLQAQIAEWEAFLNAPDLRTQLMSRYVYEHLFLARLHFTGDDPRRFFQLVRSSTPPGEKIETIATRRPFDDPGGDAFYYRLKPVEETIVHKEHLVYSLGPARMARYRALFLKPDWSVAALPGYGESEGGNPFTTFADIPPRSRYQFLLDDALFFVRSFIRGPVCHGQTAVDVIEDRFWVSFLDPSWDLSITNPDFLQDGATFLELPVSQSEAGALGDLHGFSHKNQAQYLEFRDARYANSSAHTSGFGYDAIWDGDGTNPNARITVFRHFDNASAMTGFHGGIPETAWVIDYPIFERIYYNLVAGFDVFGRVEHQLSTRIYMDELRMESEDTFLFFMPKESRKAMHDDWYKGTLAQLHTYWHQRRVDDSFPDRIAFETSEPKREFLLSLLELGDGLWPEMDQINRCPGNTCQIPASGPILPILQTLADQPGPWVKFLPDYTILMVEGLDGEPQLFSLLHDKAHDNVAFLFDETARRDPQSDVLTILPGVVGSYPNFFLRVPQSQLQALARDIKSITNQADWMRVVDSHGVRRTSPEFWATSDAIHQAFLQQNPVQAGILDLNRYRDPKSGDSPS